MSKSIAASAPSKPSPPCEKDRPTTVKIPQPLLKYCGRLDQYNNEKLLPMFCLVSYKFFINDNHYDLRHQLLLIILSPFLYTIGGKYSL